MDRAGREERSEGRDPLSAVHEVLRRQGRDGIDETVMLVGQRHEDGALMDFREVLCVREDQRGPPIERAVPRLAITPIGQDGELAVSSQLAVKRSEETLLHGCRFSCDERHVGQSGLLAHPRRHRTSDDLGVARTADVHFDDSTIVPVSHAGSLREWFWFITT